MTYPTIDANMDTVRERARQDCKSVHDKVGNYFIPSRANNNGLYILCRVSYGNDTDNGLRMISIDGNRWDDKQITAQRLQEEFIDVTEFIQVTIKER